MYRFFPILIVVCIVTVTSSSAQAESDENEAAAEKSYTPGWFRVNTDSLGTHFLIGATHSVGGVSLESNIFIDDTIGEFDFFFKSWTIGSLYSVFDEDRSNELYTRNYITYSLNKTLAIGPQVEAVLAGNSVGLVSFVVGPRINIGYGENNTLGILVGYDTKKEEEQTGLTGRLSFTRRW